MLTIVHTFSWLPFTIAFATIRTHSTSVRLLYVSFARHKTHIAVCGLSSFVIIIFHMSFFWTGKKCSIVEADITLWHCLFCLLLCVCQVIWFCFIALLLSIFFHQFLSVGGVVSFVLRCVCIYALALVLLLMCVCVLYAFSRHISSFSPTFVTSTTFLCNAFITVKRCYDML